MADTVILGSGIIGLSVAYYLSKSGNTPPERIHLVDPIADLFHCASGFAGGFLAADWFAPSVAPLGALSFKLHKELAEKHNGRKLWGYSESTGLSYSQYSEEDAVGGSGEDWLANGRSRAQAAASSQDKADQGAPMWLKQSEGAMVEVISTDDSTAQIDPLRFCRFLLDECLKRGVKLHHPARAVAVTRDEHNTLIGIKITQDGEETELPCSRIVLATGAWTPRLFSTLFPDSNTRIPISALAGHSLLLKNPHFEETGAQEMCHAVFATDTLGFSPEFFSRSGGEVYLAGLNSTQIPLPEVPSDAKPSPEAIKKLRDCVVAMMGTVEGKEVETMRESLCFRPVTSSGRPIVAKIADARLGGRLKTKPYGGVFMAAGHGAWGIAQATGTGMCMAELMEGRKPSADLSALGLP